MQVVWGQDIAKKFNDIFVRQPGRTDRDVAQYMLQAQTHNQRGSTYTTRYLYTILPKRWYTKKFVRVYDLVLKKLTEESFKLANEGIAGWHFVCLGMKGDAPALAKAGHLNRSFQTLAFACSSFVPVVWYVWWVWLLDPPRDKIYTRNSE